MGLHGAYADRGSSGGEVWERHNAEQLRELAEKRREQRKRSGKGGKEGRKMEMREARIAGRGAEISGDSLQEVARAMKAVLALDEIYKMMVQDGYGLSKEQLENSVKALRRRGRFPDVSFASGGGEEDLKKAGRMILNAIGEVMEGEK